MAVMIMSKELDELIKDLRKTQADLSKITGNTVYIGGGYLADKIRAQLNSLKTYDGKNGMPLYVPKGSKLHGLSSVQKKDILKGFGVSPLRNDGGYINVKLGFDGYGSYSTPAHPQGIPNQLLMRSLEKGTSFLESNPVVTKTVQREKKATEKMLKDAFLNQIKKELK